MLVGVFLAEFLLYDFILYPRCDNDGKEVDELCSIHSVVRMYIDSVAVNYILVEIEKRLNLPSLGVCQRMSNLG